MKVGDPLDPTVEVGPLVAERQRDRVEGYIKLGQEEGAKVAVGGGRPAGIGKGWFVEPTVFVDVDNSMRIAQEEIFGPVLAVIPYEGATTRPCPSPTTRATDCAVRCGRTTPSGASRSLGA